MTEERHITGSGDDDRQLSAMLDRLVDAYRSALAALDRAERELAETRAYFAAKVERQRRPSNR
jgi:hypothetical protein